MPRFDLGDRLRRVRRDLGYSQEAMAAALNVPPGTWSAYETGRVRPDDPEFLAKKIEILFGVPASWFQEEDEPAPGEIRHPVTAPMMGVMPHPGEVRSSRPSPRPKR
jgi:transcriptional regulator with XRE-family HTH domain